MPLHQLRLLTLGMFGLLALGLIGCGGSATSDWPDTPGPKVVASFPPIYCFAKNVAGDQVTVKSVMSNQGPHHFDPKPSEARMLKHADLFLINGLGLDEQIADKMASAASNPSLKVINLGSRVPKKQLEVGCNCGEEEEDEHGHTHEHKHEHAVDPHIWLGLDLAPIQIEGIRDALKEADPAHAADYDRRAAEYTAKLSALRTEGLAALKGKTDRKIVTFHGALTYFARSFDLEIVDVIQKVPGKDPTGKQLAKLVETCLQHKVRVIAVEPQYAGQASAKRILDELRRKGVDNPVLVELDPLETSDIAVVTPEWYETKMRANIKALADVLK